MRYGSIANGSCTTLAREIHMSGLVEIATYGLKVLTVGMTLSGDGFLNCPQRADIASVFDAYRDGGKDQANTRMRELHETGGCTSSFDGLTVADKPSDAMTFGLPPNHDMGYNVRVTDKNGAERWVLLHNVAVADKLPPPGKFWTTPHEEKTSNTSYWELMGNVDACTTKEAASEVIDIHRTKGFVAARKRLIELEDVKDATGESLCFTYTRRIRFLGKPIIEESLPYFGHNVKTSVIEAEARWDTMPLFVIITNAEFRNPSGK